MSEITELRCKMCVAGFHANVVRLDALPKPDEVLAAPSRRSFDRYEEARIARERYLNQLAEDVFDHDGENGPRDGLRGVPRVFTHES